MKQAWWPGDVSSNKSSKSVPVSWRTPLKVLPKRLKSPWGVYSNVLPLLLTLPHKQLLKTTEPTELRTPTNLLYTFVAGLVEAWRVYSWVVCKAWPLFEAFMVWWRAVRRLCLPAPRIQKRGEAYYFLFDPEKMSRPSMWCRGCLSRQECLFACCLGDNPSMGKCPIWLGL